MNPISRLLARSLFVSVLIVMSFVTVFGQATKVTIDIRMPSYDVIYVTDMFDVTSGSLSNAIPNISFALTTSPPGTSARVWLEVVATIQLKGDVAPSNLVTAKTQAFDLNGFMLISSKDLASGSSGSVRIFPGDVSKNDGLVTRLKDYILNFPTAPVGTYTIQITAFQGLFGDRSRSLGSNVQTVNVRNSSASDVSIALVEPQDAAVLASVLPSFSWTTEKQNSRIKIFEKLPQYQSPQDAVGGIPHIVQEVTGSNFNYPPDARKLEPGKTYYWFVEAEVSTNRGIQTKQSEIRMFRILSNDVTILLQLVERLFATFGGDFTTALTSMQNMGIQFTGEVTKDGSRITKEDLSRLFNQFVSNNTKLHVKIE